MATTQERTDRLAEIHATLAESIETLVSGEGWQTMLAMRAKLHRYSLNNVLLILHQMPEASMVAGYGAWTAMGRQVRKGERGIKVLAPCVYKREADDGTERSVIGGFKLATVFDVSQTDGDDVADVRPVLLDGDAPVGALSAIFAHIEAAGFSVVRGECGGANGSTNFATRTVTVRDDVSDAQVLKTAVHEAAHVALHENELGGCRGKAEVEAESVAFLVCSALGLPTDGYSFVYIAGWAQGDTAAVKATAERVIRTADMISAAMTCDLVAA